MVPNISSIAKRITGVAIYHKGQWWWYSNYCEDVLSEYGKASDEDAIDRHIDVIAWQPFPKPYKEERQ